MRQLTTAAISERLGRLNVLTIVVYRFRPGERRLTDAAHLPHARANDNTAREERASAARRRQAQWLLCQVSRYQRFG